MTQQDFIKRYHYDPDNDDHHLGGGGFGTVYKAFDDLRDRQVAIKISPVQKGMESLSLQKEVELADKLPEHRNIAHYENCYRFKTPQGTFDYGILQFYPAGNLSQLIKNKRLTRQQKEQVANGIINGLEHLHQHNVVHRDLKSSNILIAERKDGKHIPKIADFGLSKQFSDFSQSYFSNSFAGGSLLYVAPEQLSGGKIRKNVDLWSLGVVLYELFTGAVPFFPNSKNQISSETGRAEIVRKINQAEIPDKLKKIPQRWQHLIEACLIANPTDRIKKIDEVKALLQGRINWTIPSQKQASGSSNDFEKTVVDDGMNDSVHSSSGSKTPNLKWALMVLPILLLGAFGYFFWPEKEVISQNENLLEEPIQKDSVQVLSTESLTTNSKNQLASLENTPPINEEKKSKENLEQKKDEAEKTSWNNARRINTIEGYNQYLKKYPNGKFVSKAKSNQVQIKQTQKEDEQAWLIADRKGNTNSYNRYLKLFPKGKYQQKAKKELADLAIAKESLMVEVRKLEKQIEEDSNVGTFTDSRDGQVYKWVKLKDGKKWMAQNLNYKINGSWCYDNKNKNCDKYGRLYSWLSVNKVCPKGWHLPNEKEWKFMIKYYGGLGTSNGTGDPNLGKEAYRKLILGGPSGFSAKSGGWKLKEEFSALSEAAVFWSNEEDSIYIMDGMDGIIYPMSFNIFDLEPDYKDAASCRCIQN